MSLTIPCTGMNVLTSLVAVVVVGFDGVKAVVILLLLVVVV